MSEAASGIDEFGDASDELIVGEEILDQLLSELRREIGSAEISGDCGANGIGISTVELLTPGVSELLSSFDVLLVAVDLRAGIGSGSPTKDLPPSRFVDREILALRVGVVAPVVGIHRDVDRPDVTDIGGVGLSSDQHVSSPAGIDVVGEIGHRVTRIAHEHVAVLEVLRRPVGVSDVRVPKRMIFNPSLYRSGLGDDRLPAAGKLDGFLIPVSIDLLVQQDVWMFFVEVNVLDSKCDECEHSLAGSRRNLQERTVSARISGFEARLTHRIEVLLFGHVLFVVLRVRFFFEQDDLLGRPFHLDVGSITGDARLSTESVEGTQCALECSRSGLADGSVVVDELGLPTAGVGREIPHERVNRVCLGLEEVETSLVCNAEFDEIHRGGSVRRGLVFDSAVGSRLRKVVVVVLGIERVSELQDRLRYGRVVDIGGLLTLVLKSVARTPCHPNVTLNLTMCPDSFKLGKIRERAYLIRPALSLRHPEFLTNVQKRRTEGRSEGSPVARTGSELPRQPRNIVGAEVSAPQFSATGCRSRGVSA